MVSKKERKLREQVLEQYERTSALQRRIEWLTSEARDIGINIEQAITDKEGDFQFTITLHTTVDTRADVQSVIDTAQNFKFKPTSKQDRKLNRASSHETSDASLDFEPMLQLLTAVYTHQIQAELDQIIDDIKGDLDSMSEMGEMESLRLQMAMDRMSKMMSVLSNLMKIIADTQSAIVQNLK